MRKQLAIHTRPVSMRLMAQQLNGQLMSTDVTEAVESKKLPEITDLIDYSLTAYIGELVSAEVRACVTNDLEHWEQKELYTLSRVLRCLTAALNCVNMLRTCIEQERNCIEQYYENYSGGACNDWKEAVTILIKEYPAWRNILKHSDFVKSGRAHELLGI